MKFGAINCIVVLALAHVADAFQPLKTNVLPTSVLYASVRDTSSFMQEMREELAQNEEANLMMQALRGQNMNDDDTAVAGLQMRLVDIAPRDEENLPYEYNPAALKEFFKRRPADVLTRVVQVLSVGGGFLFNAALDQALGRIKNNPDLEVQRAGELRDLITSLGPFFIKIGQVSMSRHRDDRLSERIVLPRLAGGSSCSVLYRFRLSHHVFSCFASSNKGIEVR